MYTFKDLGMSNICLRPELTASVVRMFNSELSGEPLPQKLFYLGSSFRYDRPQKGRYREFTQAGVELIGGGTPEHDAEIIALACNIMDELGISNYEVVIGNIGITLELLAQKKLEERVKNYIIESLETISKADNRQEGIEKIREGLKDIGISLDNPVIDNNELLNAMKNLQSDQVQKVVAWVIDTIYGSTGERRDSQEIAKNLLSQITRDEQRSIISDTIKFIDKLTQINGTPPDVFSLVDDLIQDYNLDNKPVDELRMIAKYLDNYKIDWSKVKIDFGFGRGLQYYTGMIFEIYVHDDRLGETQKQVCGGGRYDSLVSDLGAPKVIPSLGFSFGLERLLLVLSDEFSQGVLLDVYVAPLGGETEFCHALNLTTILRKADLRVDVGTKGISSPKEHIGFASKLNANFIMFIGEDEIKGDFVSLRTKKEKKQQKYSLDEAIEIIKKESKYYE
jgi:histidyl-tRNA synthetase